LKLLVALMKLDRKMGHRIFRALYTRRSGDALDKMKYECWPCYTLTDAVNDSLSRFGRAAALGSIRQCPRRGELCPSRQGRKRMRDGLKQGTAPSEHRSRPERCALNRLRLQSALHHALESVIGLPDPGFDPGFEIAYYPASSIIERLVLHYMKRPSDRLALAAI